MSVPICSLPDCDIMATGRGDEYRGIYCVRHNPSISPRIRDNCRDADAERAAQAVQIRASDGWTIVAGPVVVCAIGGAGFGWSSTPLMGPTIQSMAIGASIGAIFGFLLLLKIAMR